MPHQFLNTGNIRSDLQTSGVSIINVPRNGRKDVADKMMIVDVLTYAMDNLAANTTIVVISGDRDFAYAVSVLRLRQYEVVLITLPNAHYSLTAQASATFDWLLDILGNSKACAALTFGRKLAIPAERAGGTKPPTPAKVEDSWAPKSRRLDRLGLGRRDREELEKELENPQVEEVDVTPTSTSTSPAGSIKARPPNPRPSHLLGSGYRPRPLATSKSTTAKTPVEATAAHPNHPANRPRISHRPIPQFEAGLRRFRFPIILQTFFSLYQIPVYQRRDVLLDIVPRFSKRPSKIFANFHLSKMKPGRLR